MAAMASVLDTGAFIRHPLHVGQWAMAARRAMPARCRGAAGAPRAHGGNPETVNACAAPVARRAAWPSGVSDGSALDGCTWLASARHLGGRLLLVVQLRARFARQQFGVHFLERSIILRRASASGNATEQELEALVEGAVVFSTPPGVRRENVSGGRELLRACC
jgi:hypothetical protein